VTATEGSPEVRPHSAPHVETPRTLADDLEGIRTGDRHRQPVAVIASTEVVHHFSSDPLRVGIVGNVDTKLRIAEDRSSRRLRSRKKGRKPDPRRHVRSTVRAPAVRPLVVGTGTRHVWETSGSEGAGEPPLRNVAQRRKAAGDIPVTTYGKRG